MGPRGVVIIRDMLKVVIYSVHTRVLHIRDNSDMEPLFADDAPTHAEDKISPETRHEVCLDDSNCILLRSNRSIAHHQGRRLDVCESAFRGLHNSHTRPS